MCSVEQHENEIKRFQDRVKQIGQTRREAIERLIELQKPTTPGPLYERPDVDAVFEVIKREYQAQIEIAAWQATSTKSVSEGREINQKIRHRQKLFAGFPSSK